MPRKEAVAKTPIWLLDTNTVSYLLRNSDDKLRQRLMATPMQSIFISSITEAELWAGLQRADNAARLRELVEALLSRVTVAPFDSNAAKVYGDFRESVRKAGKSLSAMDMLIGAHAVAVGATLVSSDKAFRQIKRLLPVENWASY